MTYHRVINTNVAPPLGYCRSRESLQQAILVMEIVSQVKLIDACELVLTMAKNMTMVEMISPVSRAAAVT